MLESQSTALKT